MVKGINIKSIVQNIVAQAKNGEQENNIGNNENIQCVWTNNASGKTRKGKFQTINQATYDIKIGKETYTAYADLTGTDKNDDGVIDDSEYSVKIRICDNNDNTIRTITRNALDIDNPEISIEENGETVSGYDIDNNYELSYEEKQLYEAVKAGNVKKPEFGLTNDTPIISRQSSPDLVKEPLQYCAYTKIMNKGNEIGGGGMKDYLAYVDRDGNKYDIPIDELKIPVKNIYEIDDEYVEKLLGYIK